MAAHEVFNRDISQQLRREAVQELEQGALLAALEAVKLGESKVTERVMQRMKAAAETRILALSEKHGFMLPVASGRTAKEVREGRDGKPGVYIIEQIPDQAIEVFTGAVEVFDNGAGNLGVSLVSTWQWAVEGGLMTADVK